MKRAAALFVHLRQELGFTQADLAKRPKCSQSLISKIENEFLEPPLAIFLDFTRLAAKEASDDLFVELADFVWAIQ